MLTVGRKPRIELVVFKDFVHLTLAFSIQILAIYAILISVLVYFNYDFPYLLIYPN